MGMFKKKLCMLGESIDFSSVKSKTTLFLEDGGSKNVFPVHLLVISKKI